MGLTGLHNSLALGLVSFVFVIIIGAWIFSSLNYSLQLSRLHISMHEWDYATQYYLGVWWNFKNNVCLRGV